jgi:signal transduction histidine kinase
VTESITPTSPTMPPAGWYDNPEGAGLRWWDGGQWTDHQYVPALPPVAPMASAALAVPVPTEASGRGSFFARLALAFLAAGIGVNFVASGVVQAAGFWIFLVGALICAITAFRQRANRASNTHPTSGLSAEAKALRLIVLVLIAAGLIFGAVKLKQSVNQETERDFGPGGVAEPLSEEEFEMFKRAAE